MPPLPSKENSSLIEHHPSGDITYERGSRLVPVGGKIEVNIGAPDFTVIFSAFPACHEAVTKIDEAPQGHKKETEWFVSGPRSVPRWPPPRGCMPRERGLPIP